MANSKINYNDNCNGTPITERDLGQATQNMGISFDTFKQVGIVPPNAKLYAMSTDRIATVDARTGLNAFADPHYFACLNPRETEAVLIQRAGSYQYPPPPSDAIQSAIECTLPLVAAAGIYQLTRNVLRKRQNVQRTSKDFTPPPLIAEMDAHPSSKYRAMAVAIAALFAFHTINGRMLAASKHHGVLLSDAYAVAVMRDNTSLPSALKKLDTAHIASANPCMAAAASAPSSACHTQHQLQTAFDLLRYGVWGINQAKPTTDERLHALQSQSITLPVEASWYRPGPRQAVAPARQPASAAQP